MAVDHLPVLVQEVVDGLDTEPGRRYIDATVGGGGHAYEVLASSSPDGLLLGLDRDPAALAVSRARLAGFGERFELVHSSFARLAEVAADRHFVPADGILFDLGLSSLQLADASRGFSFRIDGPLDMRFDRTSTDSTAADLVNRLSAEELAEVLYRYGEERQSRRIARAIVEARPLHTTRELAEVVDQTVGRRGERLHSATLTFQALRIAVNQELAALEKALPQAVDLLRPGGRLVVIAFHSLEDRIVKRFIRRESRDCICPPGLPVCACQHEATLNTLTRTPIRPSAEEVGMNPRSRSARLRIAERKA
ncbi:MAG: 16S rRNA (cytosine(1402)-N(4))-methyltransferase RsmH [Anaerolineae bacterium]|jgi:16S rRNA (cytosine1402-N4)-methyltransferase